MNKPLKLIRHGLRLGVWAMLGMTLVCQAGSFPIATASIQTSSNDALQRLSIPLEVMQHSCNSSLEDLHVLDGHGNRLPVSWIPPATDENHREKLGLPFFLWPAAAGESTLKNSVRVDFDTEGSVIKVSSDNVSPSSSLTGKTWLIDTHAAFKNLFGKRRVSALTADWASKRDGLVAQARLEGSDDLSHWNLLSEGTLMETAQSEETAIQARRIEISQSVLPKYLRLHLDVPVDLKTVNAEVVSALPEPVWYATQAYFGPLPVPKQDHAMWSLDLHASLPVRRLTLTLPQPNKILPVKIERRNKETEPWILVGQYMTYRLNRQGRELQSPPFELDGSAARYWRVTATRPRPSLSSFPLEATLAWHPAELVFKTGQPGPFSLKIDGITQHFENLSTWMDLSAPNALQKLSIASLGPLMISKDNHPELQGSDWISWLSNRHWWFWSALGAMVAVMLAGLVMTRRSDLKMAQATLKSGLPLPRQQPLMDTTEA